MLVFFSFSNYREGASTLSVPCIEISLWYWSYFLGLTIPMLFDDYGLLTLHFNCLPHNHTVLDFLLFASFFSFIFSIAYSSLSRITRFEFRLAVCCVAVWHQWLQRSLLCWFPSDWNMCGQTKNVWWKLICTIVWGSRHFLTLCCGIM